MTFSDFKSGFSYRSVILNLRVYYRWPKNICFLLYLRLSLTHVKSATQLGVKMFLTFIFLNIDFCV